MRRRHFATTLLLGFFFFLHAYTPMYANSSFIARMFSSETAGLIFSLAAALAVAGFIILPHILERGGNFKTTLLLMTIELAAMTVLATAGSPILLIIALIIHLILVQLIRLDADVFLEEGLSDKKTGTVHGAFLALTNIALVAAPFAAGFLLGESARYGYLYAASALFLVPALLVLVLKYRRFRDPKYHHLKLRDTIRRIRSDKNLLGILGANFTLRLFYAWMTIYLPLYAHEYLGLPWETIGVIFAIMLIPFALFEYPMGRLADTRFGEKEMLMGGFVLMGLAIGSLSFLPLTVSIALLTAILFASRIGASTVEVMSETYFFKHVGSEDPEIIGLYRLLEPLAYLGAPLLASLALSFMDIRFLFVEIGAVMLLGIFPSRAIQDTK